MNKARIESQRERFYLKYKKSSIFDTTPYYTQNDKFKLTDKITNKKYEQKFKPKEDKMTSRQRYIKSLYKNDLTELTNTPKRARSKIKRMKSSPTLNTKKNENNYLRSYSEKKNISLKKRKMSFYRESSVNDSKALKILRTTRNHKLRSLYSRTSDIFNVHNNSTNSSKKDSESKKYEDYVSKTVENFKRKIKPVPISLTKLNNTKSYFFKEINSKSNYIKSEREKEELLKKKVKEKSFHKKSFLKQENLKNEVLPPMYKFRLSIKNKKKKTNINNLDSVNYDIINNKKSNMRQKYIDLSLTKPSFEKISNYEIIIPKNFNQVNEVKLKNILHAEGIHFFNFSEKGDLIGGNKGKYIFKIRNSSNDKNFKNKIKKVNSKFSKINVKLNKTETNYSKKKTELNSFYISNYKSKSKNIKAKAK